MNISLSQKTIKNVRKHIDINLVTMKKEEIIQYLNQIIIQQIFSENLLAAEIKKQQILMNKPAYLGLSILEISKIIAYKFWYDYVKPQYGKKIKIMVHGYRKLYGLHKSRRQLRINFKRC